MTDPRILVATLILAVPLLGQTVNAPADRVVDEGIPVSDALVVEKCGSCHAKDAKGNLSRISWERTTPEGWEEAIKRMVRLNGLTITGEEARAIVKSLSMTHGLAPEEARPVMYIPERRILDETNIPNDIVRDACATCHPFGRPLSWRRSKDDWRLLANMHTALFPHAFFRGIGGGGARGAPANAASRNAERVNAAIDFLAKAAPLRTPEWAAWRARVREPRLTGKWLVSATAPGRGKFFGEMVVQAGEGSNEFTTQIKLQSARDSSTITRSGRAVVYAGYSWRGRSQAAGARASAPNDLSNDTREVMWFSPDQSSAEGRWFWGDYQEFGFDVKLQRATTESVVIGIDRYSLQAGSQASQVRLYGDNLPEKTTPADLDFGPGVKVRRIISSASSQIVAEVDVAPDAVAGNRDVAFSRSVLPQAIAIYDRIDYIKVVPEGAIARLGGTRFPKGYQQYEAIGYQAGSDSKLPTPFDIRLGPVEVTWSVEEFMEAHTDDDKDFVGALSPSGFFTPALEGPNPQRKFSRNNYGNVWVVGTAKSEKDKFGKLLVGKAYLVVTVPMYVMWDQQEVFGAPPGERH